MCREKHKKEKEEIFMKNNLKKLVAAVLCIAMMAAMAGCAKQAEEKNSEKSEGEA